VIADLSQQEHAALLRALRAPALWAFQLLAAQIGFDQALTCCEERRVPLAAAAQLDACGYDEGDLPLAEEVRHLVHGVRVKLAWKKSKEPLQTAAKRLGLTVREAQKGLKIYAHYGSKIERLHALRSRPSS
jgi:hypothetical protein